MEVRYIGGRNNEVRYNEDILYEACVCTVYARKEAVPAGYYCR